MKFKSVMNIYLNKVTIIIMSALPKPVLLRENTGMYGTFWDWIMMNTHVLKIYTFKQMYVNFNNLYNIPNSVPTLKRCKTVSQFCDLCTININLPTVSIPLPILRRGKTI